ncbi:hypothetical protein QUB56_25265, partial [Microcoleus sp. AR_TQ3_B6]|uniref:hypothetical protein n=1 Tax=Microcoleus sp. AR_TQ3_B6 TaxID=3055284 RepID=UPI002FD2FAD2
PPVLFGRAGRPSHFQEWKLFNSHSLILKTADGRDAHPTFKSGSYLILIPYHKWVNASPAIGSDGVVTPSCAVLAVIT